MWIGIPSLSFAKHATLRSLLKFSEPPFPHALNGGGNSTYIIKVTVRIKALKVAYVVTACHYCH